MGSRRRNPGWTRVVFGDVVRLCTERTSDPAAEGFERYVGLEHLDPGELAVRRWGDVADGTTFTTVFRPGQVLFGKRRAYQRKVGVPDFSGVCSGDIYVLESNDDRHLLPELLPFVCQTDSFFDHAIGTSAGSLSPRTNWRSLAAYEFALPPLDEQRRMATVLCEARSAKEKWRHVHRALQMVTESFLEEVIEKVSRTYSTAPLVDMAEVSYGLTISPMRRGSNAKRVAYLRVANVLRNTVDLSEIKLTNELKGDDRYRLQAGDVLVVEGHANPSDVGRACVWRGQLPSVLHQNHIIRVRCRNTHSSDFICACLNSQHGRGYFRSQSKSSSGLHTINSTVVRQCVLPSPPLRLQCEIVERMQALSVVTLRLRNRERSLSMITKRLVGTLSF